MFSRIDIPYEYVSEIGERARKRSSTARKRSNVFPREKCVSGGRGRERERKKEKSGNDIFPQTVPSNDVGASEEEQAIPLRSGCSAMKNWMMAFPSGRAFRKSRGTSSSASLAEMLQRKSLSLSRCRSAREGEREKRKKKKKKKEETERGKGERTRADYSGIHE